MIQSTQPAPTTEPKKSRSGSASRTSMIIALMEMGVTDYDKIAGAVGATKDDVKLVDMAEDDKTRQLASKGTPEGTYFVLRKPIRCPRCEALLTLVPCVACQVRDGE